MERIKKIVGERIYLSPLNEDDCRQYVRWLNDFEITDRLGVSDMANTLKSEKEWIDDNIKKGSHVYGIILAETDEIIGNIGIESISATCRKADVGLFIGDEIHRNKGYGAEALRLACKYAFDKLNLHSLHLNVFAFNERAIACYKKVGFKEAGRLREAYYCNGQYHDQIIMDILQGELK